MPHIRTFIAVELSSRVMGRVAALIDELRPHTDDVKWVRPQNMHLTLKFLGDVPDIETPEICRVVSEVVAQFEPFEIVCRGAGAFPNVREPKTLWIGITEGGEALVELQAAIDEALSDQLGYARENRRFRPHITIGRMKAKSHDSEFTNLLEARADFDADLTVIDEVVTFASFLERKGPTHEALDRASLG